PIPEGFPAGKIAIFQAPSTYRAVLDKRYPDFKYAVVPMFKAKRCAVTAGGWNVSIATRTKNPDAAWSLVDSLTRVQHAAWVRTSGYLPVRKSLLQREPTYRQYPWNIFTEQLQQCAVHRPPTAAYNFLFDTVLAVAKDVAVGRDVQKVLDDAAVRLDGALALLFKQRVAGLAFFRSAFFVPVVTSLVVVSTVWKLMYNSQGFLNGLLSTLGLSPQPFLASTTQALPSLVVMSVWKDVGFYMLIFLAGLQAISVELYESAAIDGTTRWQSFTRITLPLLRRAAVFVVVVGTISAFKIFTPVYLMTDGGPADSTMVLVFYIFRTAFRYFEMGYASAMSFILLAIVLVLTLVQFRLLRTTVEY